MFVGICLAACIPVSGTVACAVRGKPGDWPGGVLLGIVCTLVLIPPLFIGVLMSSDVLVDDLGISWFLFGRIWKTVRWDKVKRIRIRYGRNVSTKKTYTTYTVDQTKRPRFFLLRNGGITFSDEIDRVRGLLDIINHYVSKYNIEVVDLRKPTAERPAQL